MKIAIIKGVRATNPSTNASRVSDTITPTTGGESRFI
jgi:hypothetical protein